MRSEQELIAMSLALIGGQVGLSVAERILASSVVGTTPNACDVNFLRSRIISGNDPLGESFTMIRSAQKRRVTGAVLTPHQIVHSMVKWLLGQGTPTRIIDPGAGSGRFILAAGKAFPDAQLVAVEMDPLVALMVRANLHVCGLMKRATIVVNDYRQVKLPRCNGMTAFIGNPPYVRHHDIGEKWKAWYSAKFTQYGIKASELAGLHLHFFLQTRMLAQHGDIGAFITSAEWMDVNYGSALRMLLIKELGGIALHVLEPTVAAFPGTATTAAITCFHVGEAVRPVRVRSVAKLNKLNGLTNGVDVTRERLQAEPRWSIIVRPAAVASGGEIELGELFRVHRGQVTGANNIWIVGEHAKRLPERIKIPSVTKAKDLIQAGAALDSDQALRRVIDLPPDLDEFTEEEQKNIEAFLVWARAQGVDKGYVAQHRKSWWSVGLKSPAPILCTYMARRPPQFTLNACSARHINVAHGLYPHGNLPDGLMSRLVAWLNENINIGSGRTYAGGLTKFEPKEIERLRIPSPATLTA
jgi:hypothetical protein